MDTVTATDAAGAKTGPDQAPAVAHPLDALPPAPDAAPERPGFVDLLDRRPVTVEMMHRDGTPERDAAISAWAGTRPDGTPMVRQAGDGLEVWNTEEPSWLPVAAGSSVIRGAVGELYPISGEQLGRLYEDEVRTVERPSADGSSTVAVELRDKRSLTVEGARWDGTGERAAELAQWVAADGSPDAVRYADGQLSVFVRSIGGYVECPVGHRVVRVHEGSYLPLSPAAEARTYDLRSPA